MKVSYTKNFIKQSKKLRPAVKEKLVERIMLFDHNPLDSQLRNHQLSGQYKRYRSINITGDIRALYVQKGDEAIFDIVGSHSELYG